MEKSLYLSEIVDYECEFRVLYFQGADSKNCIIKSRTNYGIQASEKAVNEEIDHTTANNMGLTESILEELYDFGDSTEFPMLSFDVYVDKDGNYGLFEYSTQFGIYYSNHALKQIRKDMTKAMEIAINEVV